MMPRLDLNDIVDILFENAREDFHKTELYRLLSDKYDCKTEDYESLLSENDKESVDDYIETINELQNAEMEYIYRKGFKDCVTILKKLTVL